MPISRARPPPAAAVAAAAAGAVALPAADTTAPGRAADDVLPLSGAAAPPFSGGSFFGLEALAAALSRPRREATVASALRKESMQDGAPPAFLSRSSAAWALRAASALSSSTSLYTGPAGLPLSLSGCSHRSFGFCFLRLR